MSKKIIVAGGGLGGSLVAKLLEDDFDVTLVDSKDYFEIKWAILRALVEPSLSEKIIIPHSEYLKKATVINGSVVKATSTEVELDNGTKLPFDYLIVATGSKASPPTSAVEKHSYFKSEFEKIKAASSILIVGGGPVGVEFAGEILTDFPDKKVTIVHGGERLIEFLGPKASKKALAFLTKNKTTVILNDRVETIEGGGPYKTKKGEVIEADYVFWATGSTPVVSWLTDLPNALDENSRVNVGQTLQVQGFDNIFAIGDVTNIKEAKQGYLAAEHARKVAANIKLIAKNKTEENAKNLKLKLYVPGPNVGILSLGRANGLAQLPFGTFTGWFPTYIKSKGLFITKVRKELGLQA